MTFYKSSKIKKCLQKLRNNETQDTAVQEKVIIITMVIMMMTMMTIF